MKQFNQIWFEKHKTKNKQDEYLLCEVQKKNKTKQKKQKKPENVDPKMFKTKSNRFHYDDYDYYDDVN